MLVRLRVNCDNVCTGIGKGYDVLNGIFHHEVNINRQARVAPERLAHRRSECYGVYEVSVHHVEVYVVCSARLERFAFFAHPCKVRGQYRWGDEYLVSHNNASSFQ